MPNFPKDSIQVAIEDSNKKFIMIDADGVLYDAERFSHWASYEILAKFNDNMPDKQVMSDNMVGVKIKDQVAVIKQVFEDAGLPLVIPQNFAELRDARSIELWHELELSPIAGIVELLEWLQEQGIDYALVTRSREQPMRDKVAITGLGKYFSEDRIFYPDITDEGVVLGYAVNNRIYTQLLGLDKTDEFIYAMAKAGYKPEECIGVEDTVGGVQSIINANVEAICFTGAPTTDSETVIKNLPTNGTIYITDKAV